MIVPAYYLTINNPMSNIYRVHEHSLQTCANRAIPMTEFMISRIEVMPFWKFTGSQIGEIWPMLKNMGMSLSQISCVGKKQLEIDTNDLCERFKRNKMSPIIIATSIW